MSAIEAFLRQLDDAWGHAWESLESVLAGVGEEEAAWQAPCYRAEPREDGWPAPGTIRWQVAHLAHCKMHYTAILRERKRGESPPAPPWPPSPSWADDLRALEGAHAEQRDAVRAIPDGDLGMTVGAKMPLAAFLAMIARHDSWHGGQLALARRLYRTRGAGSSPLPAR
ncbi:MAG: DinB family protein [Planctomycetota bacterium]